MAQMALQTNDSGLAGVLYMALELSKSTWKVGFEYQGKRRIKNVKGGEVGGLRQALEEAMQKLGVPEGAVVRCCYEAGRDALCGMDFEVPAGARVALVGTSGAGKTTVINLLLGFLSPASGRILIGEQALADLDLAGVARLFGRTVDIGAYENTVDRGTKLLVR